MYIVLEAVTGHLLPGTYAPPEITRSRQDKTVSVDGLRYILYARIYIPYMRTILYHYIQTDRPPVPISSELKLKTNLLLCPVFY